MILIYRYDTCSFRLEAPACLEVLHIPEIRKIWALAAKDGRNTDELVKTHDMLRTYIVDTKEAWGAAGKALVNEYKDPTFAPKKEAPKIRKNNAKLKKACETAEATHERAKKLLGIFNETCAKYCYDARFFNDQ